MLSMTTYRVPFVLQASMKRQRMTTPLHSSHSPSHHQQQPEAQHERTADLQPAQQRQQLLQQQMSPSPGMPRALALAAGESARPAARHWLQQLLLRMVLALMTMVTSRP
jgi:hypothetical protein